jgi:hypothetical protein
MLKTERTAIMISTLLLGLIASGGRCAAPAESYPARTIKAAEACRKDVPAMRTIADEAAKGLAAGGHLLVCGSAAMISEFQGRAGGLMMIRPLKDYTPVAGDVILDFSDLEPGSRACPRSAGAVIVRFGKASGSKPEFDVIGVAEKLGVSQNTTAAIYGWTFQAELIGALTRVGKMPVVYETIGAYDGFARIKRFDNGKDAFHEKCDVPPMAAGRLGGQFLDNIEAMLKHVDKEDRVVLDKAGAWAREARKNGKQLYMYSTGHMFPSEIADTAIGKAFKSGQYDAAFRNGTHADDELAAGDLVVFIGYQHPPTDLLRKAQASKARVTYACVLRDRDFINNDTAVWIDPMWDWSDACVTIEGYDIKALPASAIMDAAIAWEVYELGTK